MKLSEINEKALREINDEELLNLHRRLHQLFGRTKEYTKEDIVNFHLFVVREMERRGLNHNPHDELDKLTEKLRKRIDFEALPNEIMVIPDFVSVVGSYVSKEEEAQDIDVLFRAEKAGGKFLIFAENIEIPIRKILDPRKEGFLHYIANPQGAHDNYMPLYDLILRKKKEKHLVQLKKIEPITKYTPQKPFMAGYTEFFSAEELWEKWGKNYEHFLISPKVDGFRTILQKKGDKISIFFEDTKEDRSEQLPLLVEELKKLPDCIIEGELQFKSGNHFVARPEILSGLAGKIDGESFVFLYDILYWDGKDIHTEPFYKRYEILKTIDLPHLIVLPQYEAKNKEEFLKACEKAVNYKFDDLPIEGVVARKYDMSYTFGPTQDYAKFKLWVELKVLVLDVLETKNGYTYRCALLDDETKEPVEIGKTFVTKERLAEPGDTLNVKVEELLIYPDGKVAWGKPYPQGLDRSRPAYTIKQAIDIARRGHCLKEVTSKALKEEGETRGEKAAKFWAENWYKCYPKSGKGRFVYQWHFRGLTEDEIDLSAEELLKRGRSVHGDLRCEFEGGLWGFTVFLGKAEDVLEGKDLSTIGDDKLQGQFKLIQPKEWLEIGDPPYVSKPGEVGATEKKYAKFFKIDKGTYEIGVWREHMFELFFSGEKIKGRYIIEYAPVGGRRIWLIEKPDDRTPYAKKRDFDEVVKELKRKRQKYLIWSLPGTKPVLVEVDKLTKKWSGKIIKAGHKYVLAPVLIPDEPDLQGDIVPAEEVQKAAWTWLSEYRKMGFMHQKPLEESQVKIVESYIAPVDMEINGERIKKGTWLLGIRILDQKLWELIQEGKITGFSIEGRAFKESIEEGENES